MKYTKLLPLYIIVATIAALLSSCIEDGVSSSSSDQPAFSVDTLDLGTVFTDSPTPTYSFLVYNRNSKVINISSVSLRDPAGTFRINVDQQFQFGFAAFLDALKGFPKTPGKNDAADLRLNQQVL